MKVNMTPNPLDVVTIHASQGDTEARQWEFELHNNGELIDTSEITEQLFFKAYKGGTEQLLPENTSTPTTSPFKGDIKYPQGLLADQEFTYRQSPTESDGLAKITDIKGNTINWNQLCRTLTSGNWAIVGAGSGTLTFADGVATFSTTNNYGRFLYTPGNLVSGHKYLLSVEIKAYANASINYALGSQSSYGSQGCVCPTGQVSDANWHRYTSIGTFTSGTDDKVLVQNNSGASNLHEIQVRNIMYFDLTQMGLDITDPSEFTSLFPLSYYDFNQGSLLSFNGNGIKTVGNNQFNSEHAISATNVVESNDNGTITIKDVSSAIWSNTYIGYSDVIAGKEYTFKASITYGRIGGNLSDTIPPKASNRPDTNIGDLIFGVIQSTVSNRTFIPNFTGRIYWWYCTDTNNANHQQFTMQPMLSTTDADFEPYTSSTLSLPISTYFPNGMDGVPYSSSNPTIVYDELTDTKAIKRTNKVIYDGSNDENWQLQSINSYNIANFAVIIDDYVPSNMNSSKCNIFTSQVSTIAQTQTEGYFLTFDKRLYIRISSSKASTVEQFRTWLASNNIEFVYRLATPTETSFTTASLVTENAEIPLSNNDGVLIGKCTEQLSENPGFIDAKIKLSDSDGECYSNKIQLHIERSPQ